MPYDYALLFTPFSNELFSAFVPLIILAVLWSIALKGFALWHSARNSQKRWLVAMLVINTIGILEVVYLIWFRSKNSHTPVRESSAQA